MLMQINHVQAHFHLETSGNRRKKYGAAEEKARMIVQVAACGMAQFCPVCPICGLCAGAFDHQRVAGQQQACAA